MLAGSDGGVYATSNASTATASGKPALFNMDNGLNSD